MIDHINHTLPRHIVTIEDPIEYSTETSWRSINQREIGFDTDSFASALKYVLRQDPDVILVGEMRDVETVSAALTAAETGHFVMSTLHTIDATETVNRIIDFFPPHQQKQVRISLAGTLRGIISQRLLPRADGQGRVPAVEVMVMTSRIRHFMPTPTRPRDRPGHQRGRVLRHDDLRPGLAQLYEEGLITLHDAAQVSTNPHDLRVMLERRGLVATGSRW